MSFKISLSLRTALETIEKLSATLDFTDYSSQIIHAIVDILGMYFYFYAYIFSHSLSLSLSLSLSPPDTCSDLRPPAMEVICSLMIQLGSRYKIFIAMVKKVRVY